MALGVTAIFVVNFVIAFANSQAALGIARTPLPSVTADGILYIGVFQVGLLAASLRRARIMRPNDLQAALGNLPLQRPLLLTFLLLINAAYVLLPVLVAWGSGIERSHHYSISLEASVHGSGIVRIFAIIVLVAGAPIIEELFFRGWLWCGLRRHWSTSTTAIVTAALFILVHYPDGGWHKMAALLLPTTLMTLARCTTKSVRGSVLTHAVNNLGAWVGAILLP